MNDNRSSATQFGSRERILAMIGGSILIILLAFTTEAVVSLHRDVAQLKDVLATKQELANLATRLGPADPAMAGLEGSCTSCHTSETFARAHGMEIDVHSLVTRMTQLTGANIPADQIPKAEAALTFMKCAHCHSIDRLKELAILNPEDRWEVIVSMMDEEGSEITPEDAQRIRDFYGDFWGWHTN